MLVRSRAFLTLFRAARARLADDQRLSVAGEGQAREREAVALRRERHVPDRRAARARLGVHRRLGDRRLLVGDCDLALLVVVGDVVSPLLDERLAEPEVRAEGQLPRLDLR